jgi:hypothetical protein
MAGHACHSVAVRASLTVLGNNVALHSMALQSGFSFAGGRENKNKNCVIVKNMSVSSCYHIYTDMSNKSRNGQK